MSQELILVGQVHHNQLTMGPAPWTDTRIPQAAFDGARAVFGTSTHEDDQRVYRTLQAYEWRRTQIERVALTSAWQPIKTAPRDGTNVLLRFGVDGESQGQFVPGLPHPWKFIDTNDGLSWLINYAVDGPGGPSHWAEFPKKGIALASYAAPDPVKASWEDRVSEIAIKLRRVARLAGVPEMVPVDDEIAVGCIYVVLGWVAEAMEKKAAEATASQPAAINRDAIWEAVQVALGDALDCTRVWGAWSIGTMSEEDFTQVRDQPGRVDEITDAAIAAMQGAGATGQADHVPGVGEMIEQPTTVAPDIEAAAKKLAQCMDYPWDHMTEEGRESMRQHAQSVIEASQKKAGA